MHILPFVTGATTPGRGRVARRILALTMAVGFNAALWGEASGLRACPHHDALGGHAGVEKVVPPHGHPDRSDAPVPHPGHSGLQAPHPDAGTESAHGGGDPAGHDAHAGPCTCVGCSCAGGGLAPEVGSSAISTDPPTLIQATRRDGTGRLGPRYAPYELPFANAPPRHLAHS